jgi:predicted SAM-dependent methyltransferase
MAQLTRSPAQFARFASALGAAQWRRVVRAHSSHALSTALVGDGAWIHLGCGPVRLEGWVNIDLNRASEADVRIDLRGGLPLQPETVSRIYSEHVLEHLSLEDGQRLLEDCFTALQPEGVIRIAMPDLRRLVESYLGDWRNQAWLDDPVYEDIDTPSRMMNVSFRSWGHRYLYDLEDLTLRLTTAGFSKIRTCSWGVSDIPELSKLERRPDSFLIVEACK